MFTIIAALFITTFVLPVSVNAAKSYGFIVGNTTVTTANYTNIKGDYIKPAKIRLPYKAYYVPSTKTLYLENIRIERSGNYNRCITNKTCAGLNVVFKGYNDLQSKDASAIRCEVNTTLTQEAGASVIVKTNNQEAICAYNKAELTIRNGSYDCYTGSATIIGGAGKEQLIVDGATIQGSTTSKTPQPIIADFATVALTNCKIMENAYTPNNKLHAIRLDRHKLLKGGLIPTIIINGQVVLSTLMDAIVLKGSTTIKGNGTLDVYTQDATGIRIDKTKDYLEGSTLYTDNNFNPTLRIEGCTIKIKESTNAILAVSDRVSLSFNNAEGVFVARKGSTLSGFLDCKTTNCYFDYPRNSRYDNNQRSLCKSDGTPVTGIAELKRGTTGIDAVNADVPTKKRGIYNLQGVRLGDSLDRLPAGIYIVDGRKEVKK